ncbi:MAG: hypothetical protein LKI80_12440 [Sporolactobacillus sp.]|nr:hypothetical protein [Sporolactobacillus sp.]
MISGAWQHRVDRIWETFRAAAVACDRMNCRQVRRPEHGLQKISSPT